MPLVVTCRSFRKPRARFDQRPPTTTSTQKYYRTNWITRRQQTFRRLSFPFRGQESSTFDIFTYFWRPISNNRVYKVRNSTGKQDNPSLSRPEGKTGESPEDKECIDVFEEEPVLNSNVNPAPIIVSQMKGQPETAHTKEVVKLVTTLLIGGIFFSILTFVLVNSIGPKLSMVKVMRKFIKSDVARHTFTIIGTMIFVRSGLTPVVQAVREFLDAKTPWENSVECYVLKELYSPLELLLGVAALSALVESVLPTLVAVPRPIVAQVLRTILSLMFVIASARVVHNMKGRIFRETKWRMEIEGRTSEQHRLDAVDKLLTIAILIVAVVLSLQSIGLDVNSVLAIGGVGGLAIGLAGREIFENFISGLLIMGSRPFDVGDEIICVPTIGKIEGIVIDVGWYRTLVRNWEREVFVIPNSLFSRSIVQNVTRKGKEWRFFEFLPIQLKDLDKIDAVLADMRRIMRQDSRVVQKLHKRAFLDDINREYVNIYISFYLEVPNRDAFMAARQQLYMAFVDCVLRNGAEISEKKLIVEYRKDLADLDPDLPLLTREEMMDSVDMPVHESDIDEHPSNGARSSSSHVELPRGVKKISSIDTNDED